MKDGKGVHRNYSVIDRMLHRGLKTEAGVLEEVSQSRSHRSHCFYIGYSLVISRYKFGPQYGGRVRAEAGADSGRVELG